MSEFVSFCSKMALIFCYVLQLCKICNNNFLAYCTAFVKTLEKTKNFKTPFLRPESTKQFFKICPKDHLTTISYQLFIIDCLENIRKIPRKMQKMSGKYQENARKIPGKCKYLDGWSLPRIAQLIHLSYFRTLHLCGFYSIIIFTSKVSTLFSFIYICCVVYITIVFISMV